MGLDHKFINFSDLYRGLIKGLRKELLTWNQSVVLAMFNAGAAQSNFRCNISPVKWLPVSYSTHNSNFCRGVGLNRCMDIAFLEHDLELLNSACMQQMYIGLDNSVGPTMCIKSNSLEVGMEGLGQKS